LEPSFTKTAPQPDRRINVKRADVAKIFFTGFITALYSESPSGEIAFRFRVKLFYKFGKKANNLFFMFKKLSKNSFRVFKGSNLKEFAGNHFTSLPGISQFIFGY
jgi:hypothetical protein